MLSTLIIATAATAMATGPLFSEEEYQGSFRNWTSKFEKQYEVADFFKRYNAFKSNMDFVTRHNVGGYSYTVELNQFADLTNAEFRSLYHGLAPNAQGVARRTANLSTKAPDSVDWVSKGAVTPVKNQGQCGSCWAFSSTGSLEGSNFLVNGNLVSLSEQQLVDCSGSFGNQGCNGGLMDNAFKYVEKNGLCTESDYPYTGRDGSCQTSCSAAIKLSTYNDVPAKDLDSLASAVAQQPVSVAVDAAGTGWQLYSGGIYKGGLFGCGTQLDHGVLAVGYGTASGKDYWLVKNSWGATWGEQGYIRLSKKGGSGAGTCGIALSASYPTVA
mmetsp:Transcript_30215/g.42109  ORF Transcript_30215/g.42109 Transcript_30215/m.42109 type:complete len:328 (+) Transcript_30215:59-1042(+)